jgi:hypothetical protein
MKIGLIIFLSIITFILITLVSAVYTSPNYDNVTIVLKNSYVVQSYDNVTIVLGEIAPCSPTMNSDWIITDTQICDAKEVTIGTGSIIVTTGNLTLINGANVTAKNISISSSGDKVFINSKSKLVFT